jgi:hypothetical protein
MTSRATRINTIPAGARLSAHVGDLKDVSVTGALVVLDEPLPLGSRHLLSMGVGTPVLELWAQVVRARETTEQPPRWQVGVRFVDLTPEARRAIPAGVARLLETLDSEQAQSSGR